jgi:hypothetical protein
MRVDRKNNRQYRKFVAACEGSPNIDNMLLEKKEPYQ